MFAALIGVAAGIGVGILLAPAKGSKTRKRLKKRLLGLADTMQDDLSEKLNAIKSVFSREEDDELTAGDIVTESKEGT